MRNNIPAGFVTALSQKDLKFFFIVAIHATSASYYFSSFPTTVTIDGFLVQGGANLLAVDTPRASSSVDKEQFKVVLSGDNPIPLSDHKNGLAGRKMEVWIGRFDTSGAPVASSFDDMMLAYRGTVDQDSIQNDFESLQVIITGASPMANLDQRGGYPVSRDGMDQINVNDTSFDFLYKGSSKTLEWGKS
jgi:hypothetical protein